jgi:hypothetical protein
MGRAQTKKHDIINGFHMVKEWHLSLVGQAKKGKGWFKFA